MSPYLLGAGVAGAAALWLWVTAIPRWRARIVGCARKHVRARTLYEWGGGHHPGSWGLDCSGLVIVCAAKAGLDLRGWDSRRMWAELPRVVEPSPGDLACYAPRHVVIVERWDKGRKVAAIIGANGGGPAMTSPEAARAAGAFVKRELTHLYRSGFLGFVTLSKVGNG